jgi:hypothetical protein
LGKCEEVDEEWDGEEAKPDKVSGITVNNDFDRGNFLVPSTSSIG